MVKKNLKISLGKEEFDGMYTGEVVRLGNGAMVKSFKKYIGREVIILVKKEMDLVGNGNQFDKMEID